MRRCPVAPGESTGRTAIVCLGVAVALAHTVSVGADAGRTTFGVWPGKAPGEVGTVGDGRAKAATQPEGTKGVPPGEPANIGLLGAESGVWLIESNERIDSKVLIERLRIGKR